MPNASEGMKQPLLALRLRTSFAPNADLTTGNDMAILVQNNLLKIACLRLRLLSL